MTDRIPLYPGRVTLAPVAGQTNKYDMAMADEPSEVGTPLNKANLLTDATAQKFVTNKLSANAPTTPNEAFSVLADGTSTVFLNEAYTSYQALRKLTNPNPAPALSVGRYQLASVNFGSYALFAGGTTGSYSAVVNAYNTSLTRTQPTALSVARSYLKATVIGSYALFGGGYTGSNSNVVDAYNTSLTRSTATALGSGRRLHTAVSNSNYALFAGGDSNNTVDAYNTSLTKSTASNMANARADAGGFKAGNYAVIGGGNNSSNYYSTVDAYNNSLTKSVPTALSAGRARMASATVGSYGLFCGGNTSNSSGDVSAVVDAYNTSLTRSTPTALGTARGYLGECGVSSSNYALIGGGNGGKKVDAYTTSLSRSVLEELSNSQPTSPGAAAVGDYALFNEFSSGTNAVNYMDTYNLAKKYFLTMTIPALSRYHIPGVTSSETFTKDGASIVDKYSDSKFNGYIKRGFTLTGQF